MSIARFSKILRQPVVRISGSRTFSSATPVTLPDLAYDYGALEPLISGDIMALHHSKHHQTYINNYNALIEKYLDAEAKGDLSTMLSLQPGINFNGGGHVNHSLFWQMLAPANGGGGGAPSGKLSSIIDSQFGSFDAFKTHFNATAAAVQGSGWCWLGYSQEKKMLEVATRGNQDPLTGLVPLIGVDMWEHAYYLQYKNVRPDYLNAFWDVANWKYAEEQLAASN